MSQRKWFALGIAFIGVAGLVQGADKADPTGTWKLTAIGKSKVIETPHLLKLKFKDNKLTGTHIHGRDNNLETTIEDASFKDGEVTFSTTVEVVRKEGKMKATSKWKGTLDGDRIKFKLELERNGQTVTREMEAKREEK